MSIYSTLFVFSLEYQHPYTGEDGERYVDDRMAVVVAQGVPGHIDDAGDAWSWLPPPVSPPDYSVLRAVVFVLEDEPKGTARNGQEYVRPLLTLDGSHYRKIRWHNLMAKLSDRLQERMDEAALRASP